MPSKTVEFRYLQVITNHLSCDRVTVGLAHWDGSALRFACAVASLRNHAGFVEIQRAVRAIKQSMTRRSEELRSASSGVRSSQTLAELAPGSELVGDALVWSEVRRGITGDAAAHFTEARKHARPASDTTRRVALPWVDHSFGWWQLARDFDAHLELVKTGAGSRGKLCHHR